MGRHSAATPCSRRVSPPQPPWPRSPPPPQLPPAWSALARGGAGKHERGANPLAAPLLRLLAVPRLPLSLAAAAVPLPLVPLAALAVLLAALAVPLATLVVLPPLVVGVVVAAW